MNTKAFFLCWKGSNLILGIGKENQIFILRTPATIKLFIKFSKNDILVLKSLPTQMNLYDPYMVPTLFHGRIIIFQGVLTKFNFSI